MSKQQMDPGFGLITSDTCARSTDDMSDLAKLKTTADILDWNQTVDYVAEDIWLAIAMPQHTIPRHLLILYSRFMHLGWIERYGDRCIFMAELIRRILRIHRFEAYFREYKRIYQNRDRGWYDCTGLENPEETMPLDRISTHAVCVTGGYILDWAGIRNIYWTFGAMSPWAFIGKDTREWQTLKIHGEVKWEPRTSHRLSKNDRLLGRQEILDCVKLYFYQYQI